MIIDAHVQVGKSIYGYELSPNVLLRDMKQYGIHQSVISPVQPYSYHLNTENNYISQVVLQHPEDFIGFCRVDPRQGKKAIAELERSIHILGLQGLYLHPWEEGYRANDGLVVEVVKQASKLRIPVMIATGYPWVSHALQVADLAKEVTDASIIMTHGGQINISGLAQADAFIAMQSSDNLYIETSGVYRQDFIEEAIEEFGCHRVLFGSNAPKMHQGFELDRAISATKEFNREFVLGKSFQQLLRI